MKEETWLQTSNAVTKAADCTAKGRGKGKRKGRGKGRAAKGRGQRVGAWVDGARVGGQG